MPATTAPAAKPNKVDAFIALELSRIQRTKDNPATNPENIPDIIFTRMGVYAKELHDRRRNRDYIDPGYTSEDMSQTEVAHVLAALARTLADHLDACVKQPDWEQRSQQGDWKRSVEHYARVNNG